MVIILMVIAIITRYVSETDTQISGFLLLKLEPSVFERAMATVYSMRGVREVRSLIGYYDILLTLQITSQRALNEVIQKISMQIDRLQKYYFLFNKDVIYEEESNDTHKGESVNQRMEARIQTITNSNSIINNDLTQEKTQIIKTKTKKHEKKSQNTNSTDVNSPQEIPIEKISNNTNLTLGRTQMASFQNSSKNSEDDIHILSFLKIQPNKSDLIFTALKSIPNVKKIISITGEFDLLIEIQTQSSEQLVDIISKQIESISGIKKIQSHYVMNTWEK
jgi:DNA-binding Lrp family transcriptional regulator